MGVSTSRVKIAERNTVGVVIESEGSIPWDEVNWNCSFRNAVISRELYGSGQELEVEGLEPDLPPVRLFDRDTLTFPIGLKNRVTECLKGQGIQVEWMDETVPPDARFNFEFSDVEPTREYQRLAVEELLQSRFGMLQAPTGSGKSHMESLIVSKLGVRTLWVVHTADLVHQTADFLRKYLGLGEGSVGKVGAGKFSLKTLTVATVQSLRTKWSQIAARGWKPGLLIEDEVHHHGAWRNYQAMRTIEAYYRYGFSATPDRLGGDKILLEAGYGHVETQVSMKELTDQGFLVPIEVQVIEVTTPIPKGAGGWQAVYDQGIVEHVERNSLICHKVQELVADGRQVLVDVDQVEHLQYLEMEGARQVTGEMDADTRKELYDAFRRGEIQVLVGTVLREGLDLPTAGAIVLAGGKKSKVAVLQQIGRGLRVAAGKSNCIVVDFNDNQHGTLLQHSQNRLKLMRHVGFQVPEGAIKVVHLAEINIPEEEIERTRKRQQAMADAKFGGRANDREDAAILDEDQKSVRQEERDHQRVRRHRRSY